MTNLFSGNQRPNSITIYNREVSLLSTRWVFRLEDISQQEQLWINNLKDGGFHVDHPSEIFTPFTGQKVYHLNVDIGTRELRLREWAWTDSRKIKHTLLDINAWPGDN